VGYRKWLPNCGAPFLSGVEKSLTYRRNKRQPSEAAALQETQIPVEFTGRREKSQISNKQNLADVQKTPTTERIKYERSPQEERLEVLTFQEAEKLCHESGVEANTQTSPIGKRSNELSALITKVKGSRRKCC
jgi:hypothetical protein